MRKCLQLLPLAVCAVLLSSCSAKLSTIRPTLITRIVIEDINTGDTGELLRKDSDEGDWLMDDLVLQTEQFYKKDGECEEEDPHTYLVDYYRGDDLEMSLTVNSDGSICMKDNHYVLADKSEEEIDEYIKNWEKALFLGKEKDAES